MGERIRLILSNIKKPIQIWAIAHFITYCDVGIAVVGSYVGLGDVLTGKCNILRITNQRLRVLRFCLLIAIIERVGKARRRVYSLNCVEYVWVLGSEGTKPPSNPTESGVHIAAVVIPVFIVLLTSSAVAIVCYRYGTEVADAIYLKIWNSKQNHVHNKHTKAQNRTI